MKTGDIGCDTELFRQINQEYIMKPFRLAELGAIMLMAGHTFKGNTQPNPDDFDIKRDRQRADEAYMNRLLQKGVKEFTIDGHTVIARDYKNALRKVNRRLH